MVFDTQQKASLTGMSVRPEVSFGTSSRAIAASPTSGKEQSNDTHEGGDRSGGLFDAAARSGGPMPGCLVVSRGRDGAAPGRWWRRVLADVCLVGTTAIVAAGSVLAVPDVVYAQSTHGPMARGAIPEQRLRVDGWSVTLNVRESFEASGALVITADSLDETVATASATGETVTVVPVKRGATVVEVVAQNSAGSALQRISVTVGPAVPPMAYTLDTVAATRYRITNPQNVAVDGDGNLYVVESLVQQGHRIHKVDAATGTISIIAGTGEDGYSGDGGPAVEAQFNQPEGLAVDGHGNIFVADALNHRIRRVDAATGTIDTIAGTGEQGTSGDGGPATEAKLAFPEDVAVDDAGNVYITDGARIRKVDADEGTIRTIAGMEEHGYSGDGGPAAEALLSGPDGVAVDDAGNVYIADSARIRKVDAASGVIDTIAGIGDVRGPVDIGNVGDGGPATEARLSFHSAMAVDGHGNVYVADNFNHRIRRVDAFTGIIDTIAGTGEQLCCQHGSPATEFRVSFPNGLAVDASGNVYFTETGGPYISFVSGKNDQDRVRVLKPLFGVTLRTPDGTLDLSGYFTGFDAVRYEVESPDGIVETVLVMGSEVAIAALNAGVGVITVTAIGSDGTRATLTIPVTVDAAVLAYTISTLAGNSYVWDGEPATRAWLESPGALAVDAIGNLYIVDRGHQRIRKVDAFTGRIRTMAGTGEEGYSGDGGPATKAMLSFPNDVAVDAIGNVYIADGNSRIRKVDAFTETISTIAGTGERGYSGDGGLATEAQLGAPFSVAVDGAGNLYISETVNSRIRKVDAATGIISTIAGTGERDYSGDGGPAAEAPLWNPLGVTVDGAGNLYIADNTNSRIRKVDAATGIISTVAGMGRRGHGGDGGPATEAQLVPRDVAVDGAGNLYIASANRIRRVDGAGIISTIPHEVNPLSLRGLAVDPKGNVYFTQSFTNVVRKFDPAAGTTLTAAGGGYLDHFIATLGKLSNPGGVAVDSFGNVYVADTQNQRVRGVSAYGGGISTIVGTGERGYSGDGGPATEAGLAFPNGVAVDASGNIYISDGWNRRIRKVDAGTWTITTIAGTGERGYSGDGGPPTEAKLGPSGVAADSAGNIFIADAGNNRIRKVDVFAGIISTNAGTGEWGYAGDGGPASEAMLSFPDDVAVDRAGNVYIADGGNNRIRKVDAFTGIISTIAGAGERGYAGDGGPATEAGLNSPGGVAVDDAGNVYIADTVNHRIRKVGVFTGIISTIAGTGEQGYGGDGGPATGARLNFPGSVATGAGCRLYIADAQNHRIRVLTPNPALESGGCASDAAAGR